MTNTQQSLLSAIAVALLSLAPNAWAQDANPRVGLPIQSIDRCVNADVTGLQTQDSTARNNAHSTRITAPASTWGAHSNPTRSAKVPAEVAEPAAKQPASATVKAPNKRLNQTSSQLGAPEEDVKVAQSPLARRTQTPDAANALASKQESHKRKQSKRASTGRKGRPKLPQPGS